MFTIDEISMMLDEVAAELPDEVFKHLNGGVSLLPDVKLHEAGKDGGLYTLGEYRHDQMGRYIVIYYGSLLSACPGFTPDKMRARLRKLLAHELTHHLESLAGERGLELEDERDIEAYRHGIGEI